MVTPFHDDLVPWIVGASNQHPALAAVEKLVLHADNQRAELARLNKEVDNVENLKRNIRGLEAKLEEERRANRELRSREAIESLDNVLTGLLAEKERDQAVKTQVLLYRALLSGTTLMQLVDKTKRPAWMDGLAVLNVGILGSPDKPPETYGSFRFAVGNVQHTFSHKWIAPGTPVTPAGDTKFYFGSNPGDAREAKAA